MTHEPRQTTAPSTSTPTSRSARLSGKAYATLTRLLRAEPPPESASTPTRKRFTKTVKVLSLGIVAAAIILLVGNFLGKDFFHNPLTASRFNSTIGFIILGTALWLCADAPPKWRSLRGITVSLLGLAGLLLGMGAMAEYIWGIRLSLGELIVPSHAVQFGFLNRLTFLTSLNLMLMGLAFLLWVAGKRPAAANRLATVAFMLALLSLIAVGVYKNNAGLWITPMPFSTALLFIGLCVGFLMANTTHGLMALVASDSPGAFVIRRLVPMLVVLIGVGRWIILQGQYAGWYNAEFSIALSVVYYIAVSSALVIKTGISLHYNFLRHRKTEEALIASGERLRLLASAVPSIMWEADAQGSILLINEKWTEFTGQPVAEALGDGWTRMVHPEDLPCMLDIWQTSVKHGVVYEVQGRFTHQPSGGYRWMLVRALPLRNAQSQIICWYGTNTDIDAQKQLEVSLEAALERFRLVSLATHDAVWDWDLITGQVEWSEAAYAMFKYPAGSISHDIDWWYAHIHPEDKDAVVESLHQVIDQGGETWSGEYRFRCGDGSWATVIDRGFVARNERGQPIRMVGSMIDITERKRSERALHESEGRLRLFVENSPVTVAMLDREMRYMVASNSWIKSYGLPQDIVGQNHYAVFSGPMPSHWPEAHQRGLAGEIVTCEEDFYVTPRGQGLWLRWEVHPWHQEDGSVGGIIIYSQDITQRKLAESRVKRIEESNIVGVFYWHRDGRILDANDAFLHIVGYSREALEAGQVTWTGMTRPEDHARDQWVITEEMEQTGRLIGYEKTFVRQDGTEVQVYSNSAFLDSAQEEGVSVVLDITERKQAEAALMESEARFRTLADASPVLIWMTGPDGGVTYLNKTWEDFTGVKAADASGFDWRPLIHPDDIDETVETLMHAIEHREIWVFENRLRHRDGSYRWTSIVGRPRFTAEGVYLGHIGILMDVTERKEAELAVQASEARFRAAIQAVQGILWTNNPQGEMEGEQPGWAALTGQRYEEYQGTGWTKAVHPEDAEATIAAWQAAVREKRLFVFEHRVRRFDGAWRHFSIRAIPLSDAQGEVYQWVGVHTDITEMREAQTALSESELRFRTMADAVPTTVWTTTPTGEVTYLNSRWYEYTGLTPSESLDFNWTSVLHPDDYQQTMAAWGSALARGHSFEMEHRLRRQRNGQYRWFVSRAYPHTGSNGEIKGWYGSSADIDDLKAAQARAEEANKRKSQFLANMSHELRTPLNAVIGYADMIRRGMGGPLTTKQTRYADNIASSGRHLLAMVNDILDLSKAEAGKIDLKVTHIELAPFTAHLLDMLAVTAQEKQVALHLEVEPGLDGLDADPDRLRQIFFNLMSNAIKFNRQGGEVTVRIHKSPDRQWVISQVQDTGIGIPQDKVPRLFSEFFQVDSSMARQYEGTGLGLALTRRLVELHGGTIWVDSQEGVGTTFTFTMPVVPPLDAQQSPPP